MDMVRESAVERSSLNQRVDEVRRLGVFIDPKALNGVVSVVTECLVEGFDQKTVKVVQVNV
jgi:hypothetical protein